MRNEVHTDLRTSLPVAGKLALGLETFCISPTTNEWGQDLQSGLPQDPT